MNQSLERLGVRAVGHDAGMDWVEREILTWISLDQIEQPRLAFFYALHGLDPYRAVFSKLPENVVSQLHVCLRVLFGHVGLPMGTKHVSCHSHAQTAAKSLKTNGH